MKQELIVKLIEMLITGDSATEVSKTSDIYSSIIGKYVICRTRNDGVNFGKVVSASKDCVHLVEAQRLHWFKPKTDSGQSWYEGVASYGISEDSRISCKSEKFISEDYSLTLCSDDCIKSIQEVEPHEQS